jgi:uncharacterized protein YijF (DUF1287 family)
LLVLPFVLLALAIGVSQAFRPSSRLAGSVAWPASGRPLEASAAAGLRSAIRARPPRESRAVLHPAPATRAALPAQLSTAPIPPAPLLVWIDEAEMLAAVVAADEVRTTETADLVATRWALREIALVQPSATASPRAPEPLTMAPLAAALAPLPLARLSLVEPEPVAGLVRPAKAQPPIFALAALVLPSAEAGICTTGDVRGLAPRPPPLAAAGPGAEAFGLRVSAAAVAQTREVVIYNDRYRRLAFPMGDVPPLYGVCTDVVVRAFRALGLDLQALVQVTGSGSGDPNIDHRRTETLRRFFALQGAALPVTDFAEDYQPGDVVTYHRPQNQHSRSHIAIVSDRLGPSGRPMIVHNRGWGPQLEDGLFVDEITGHYRFAGPRARTPAVPMAAAPAAQSIAATPRLRGTAAAGARRAIPAAVAEQTPAPPGSAAPRVR